MSTLKVNNLQDINGANNSTPEQVAQGRAKAWCRFIVSNGTPSIDDSFNISSITDNNAGDFTFTFNTAMANTTYATLSTSQVSTSNINIPCLTSGGQTTTTARLQYFRITTLAGGGSVIDPVSAAVAVFGD